MSDLEKYGRVVVLDRDGTIVIDKNYLADPSGLEFANGAKQGLRRMQALGCRFVVITNQSGVARGLMSLEQVHLVNEGLRRMMQAIGASPDGIYFCPHGPNEGCSCRKPQTKLLIQAGEELSFEPASSIVIGDKPSDVEFGRRVGAITMLVGDRTLGVTDAKPDYRIKDLNEAVAIIARLRHRKL